MLYHNQLIFRNKSSKDRITLLTHHDGQVFAFYKAQDEVRIAIKGGYRCAEKVFKFARKPEQPRLSSLIRLLEVMMEQT